MGEGAGGGCGGACGCEGCAVPADSQAAASVPEGARPTLATRRSFNVLPGSPANLAPSLLKLLATISDADGRREPVHERVELRAPGGTRSVRERGCPLTWHPEFGLLTLLDDEDPIRQGEVLSREDLTVSDGGGVRCVTRILSRPLPRRPRPPTLAVGEASDAGAARTAAVERMLTRGENATHDAGAHRVLIRVRDQGVLPRIPARCIVTTPRPELTKWCGLLSQVADTRRALRTTLRRRWAAGLIAHVRGHGGTVRRHHTAGPHLLEVDLSPGGLRGLADHPDVAAIGPRPRSVVNSASLPADPWVNYLCTGIPSRVDARLPDLSPCNDEGAGSNEWGDARRAILNAQAYLDAGYDGAGASAAGGLAPWAILDEIESTGSFVSTVQSVPHVTLLVHDDFPDPHHPAFGSELGEYRVRYYIAEDGSVARPDQVPNAPASTAQDPHGTQVAGTAAGSVEAGQDVRVPGTGRSNLRPARSGIAPRALFVFSAGSWLEALRALGPAGGGDSGAEDTGNGDTAFSYGQQYDGVDIVVSSTSVSENVENYKLDQNDNGKGEGEYWCPVNGQARGTDEWSAVVTYLYGEHSVLSVISAGNTHSAYNDDTFGAWTCSTGSGVEATSPASSPAALSVGAHGYVNPTVALDQVADGLQPYTAGESVKDSGHTPDGRTYPLLVAWSQTCGVSTIADDPDPYRYDQFSGTSASAPGVAGCAVLFKHWYLDHHGADTANQPGRLMSNLLNMADGFATDTRASGGSRVAAPTPTWGLGRFRMRYFGGEGMSSPYMRSTKGVPLTSSGDFDLLDLGHPDTKLIPMNATRLVVTLWWLEVNTGDDEQKADIWAMLMVVAGEDMGFVETRRANGDHLMRFQYDCSDESGTYGPVPRGRVQLMVSADSMPTEKRYPNRDCRTVYVSWFWECGEDRSLIDCSSRPACPGHSAANLTAASTDILRLAQLAAQNRVAPTSQEGTAGEESESSA